MAESIQGQRTADERHVRVSATVNTLDEALSWMVIQLDRQRLANPQGGFSPVVGFIGEDEPPETYYEVWVAGTSDVDT